MLNDNQNFYHFNAGQSTKRNTEKVFALSLIMSMLEDDFFLLLFPYMDLETLLIRLLPKVSTNRHKSLVFISTRICIIMKVSNSK